MNKRIAIIGASELQLPLIEKAKSMGLETHVFAWKIGDVGEKAADFFYPISIRECDTIIEICQQIQPSAVVSIASDLAAITVNKVANALKLPANPIETAIIATNKHEMRMAFQKAGLYTPAFMKVRAGDDLNPAKRMHLPLIVKPTDRSGSRGIFMISSFESLAQAVEASCNESFEKCAIIEEFIEGEEYSCECISQDGVHHCLALTKKFTTGAPHFIEIGHLEPSGLNEDICMKVEEQVFIALDALHIRCGASHSEFKVDKKTGEIRLIEIGARMGGDCIGSDLVFLSTGYDYIRMVIDAAMGTPISFQQEQHLKAAAVRYIMNQNDYLFLIKNQETAVNERIVRQSEINLHQTRMVTDSSTRYGFFIAVGDNSAELCKFMRLPS